MTATFALLFIITIATLTTVCYMKAMESMLLNNVSFERYLPKKQQALKGLLEEELKELRRTIKLSPLKPNSSAIAQCLKCTKAVFLAVRAAFVSGNNFERFINICDRIRGMLQCINRIRGKCSNTREIETLTDNLRYLCEDQFYAYKHIVECLDAHSATNSLSCSKDCHLNQNLLGWFLYGYMRDSMLFTVPDDETPPKVNVPYFRKVSTDACKMFICYLGCIRENYNAKCEGFGGSLLLEALLRTLLSLHKSWAFSPITNTLRLLLPSQCNIITTERGLNYFRLSEEADFNLKQWFSEDSTHKHSNLFQNHNLSRNHLQLSLSRSAISSLLDREQLPNSNLRISGKTNGMPNIRVLIILALQLAVNQLAVVVGLHVDKQDKLLLKRRENVSPLDQISYFDNLLPIKHASFGNRRQIQGKAAESTEKTMNFLSGSLRSPLNLTLTKSPKFPMDLAYCISCMKPLMLAARAAIVSGNGYERFVNICDRINNLIKCKQRFQMHCKNIKEMEGIMDTLQFLCTKQYKTYESLADCIDAHSAQVVRVCEDECHASKTMVGWFLYGFMHSATPITVQHGEVPAKVHVGYFRKLSSEACKILQCHLLCLKKRYDKKCGGFGGSMMLEALLRPFAPLYDSWLMNPILNTFKLTLPTQCDFIADENEFKSYRLDEEQIQRIQEFIANVPRFPLDNGLRIEPRSRTAPELQAKLMSLFSQNRHPEAEDFIRHPVPIGSELTEDDLHLGDLEEQIMELKMKDQKQRYALAVSNNWNVS